MDKLILYVYSLRGFSKSEIARQLGVNRATVRKYFDLYQIPQLKDFNLKKCNSCEKILNLSKFTHRKSNNKIQPYHECKRCKRRSNNKTIYKNKATCVKYLGGKCTKCNYNKNLAALEFHHLDPSKKEFNLSHFGDYRLSTIKSELDKCVLLCSNCHKIEHSQLEDYEYL